MRLYCDNITAIHIVENLIFYKRTKHIDGDCHLIRQKVTEDKIIELKHIFSINQSAEKSAKPLGGP